MKLTNLLSMGLIFGSVSPNAFGDSIDLSKFVIRGGLNYSLINPKDANTVIDTLNGVNKAAGLQGYNLPQISKLLGPEFGLGYRYSDDWEFGLSYTSLSTNLSAMGTATGYSYSTKVNLGSTAFHIRPLYYFYKSENLRLHIGSAVGIVSYSLDASTNDNGNNTAISAASSGLSVKPSVGAEIKLTSMLGVSFDIGYAVQPSAPLKVNSTSGATTNTVGNTLRLLPNKDLIADLSGFQAMASIVISLPNSGGSTDSSKATPVPAGSGANEKALELAPSIQQPSREPQSIRNSSVEDKLNRLRKMLKDGLISEQEYSEKRKNILENF